jgi:hypothetical protein
MEDGPLNSDIRISTTFFSHHKTKKLIRRLGADGVCYLLKIWTYAAQYRPNGILTGMTAEDIAVAVDWAGEPNDLVDPLCEIGFINQRDNEGYSIHDWEIHNAYAAAADERSQAASKAAKARWAKRGAPKDNSDCDKEPFDLEGEKGDGNASPCGELCGSMRSAQNSNAPSPFPSPSPSPKESTLTGTCSQAAPEALATCPHQAIIDLYHTILPELPKVRSWNETNKSHLRARWKSVGLDGLRMDSLKSWERLFEYIRSCPFLMGATPPGLGRKQFVARLRWIVNQQNFQKIVEGDYEA